MRNLSRRDGGAPVHDYRARLFRLDEWQLSGPTHEAVWDRLQFLAVTDVPVEEIKTGHSFGAGPVITGITGWASPTGPESNTKLPSHAEIFSWLTRLEDLRKKGVCVA